MLSYIPAAIVSLVGHAVLLVLLWQGWNLSHPPEPVKPPNYIKATLLDVKAVAKESAPKEAPKPPKIDLQKKKQEQELQRKKAAAEAARKKQIALEKAKKEKEKKEAEERRKKELEAQRKKEEQQRQELERQQLEESLVKERERLAAELKAEQLAQQAEADEQMTQSYSMLIRQRIEQNWSRPPSARNDMEAHLRISMIPTGEIIDVVVSKSSGNSPFDRSAVQAVNKTRQIPEIKDMPSRVFEQQFRSFTLTFSPGDLRQ